MSCYFGSQNWPTYRELVRRPEFADAKICVICAVGCGALWPGRHAVTFTEGTCPCCGRTAGLCVVSYWKWGADCK